MCQGDTENVIAAFIQWTLKPENSLLWHHEVIGWINKYVGMDKSELVQKTQDLRI